MTKRILRDVGTFSATFVLVWILLFNLNPIETENVFSSAEDQVEALPPGSLVCEGKVEPSLKKRALRKVFKEFYHPFDFRGRIVDWYKFRLVWRGFIPNTTPQTITCLQGSDRGVAEQLKIILQIQDYQLLPGLKSVTRDSCGYYSCLISINLGNGLIKYNPDK